jgi:hypothetical protein
MTERPPTTDGPPVFLPEPPRPAEPRDADAAALPDALPMDQGAPGTGRRLEPSQPEPTGSGLPRWVIWVGLVAMVALSVEEGSPFPILIGFAAFYLLRRRARR